MPFIEVKTSVRLSEGQKDQLKAGLGRAITVIPGKTESVTMVGLVGDYDLYLGGHKLARGAFVDVKLFGEATIEDKESLCQAVCELMRDVISLPDSNVYLTFSEKAQWGLNGQLLS